MNSEDKKLLFQEYIMLLQLHADYVKSQLLIKVIYWHFGLRWSRSYV